jgi:hypothetical protein
VSTATLYDRDFYRWSLEQAERLRRLAAMRANLAAPLDLDKLAEEIESSGKSQAREVFSRCLVLLVHLLEWRHRPQRRSRSSRSTIRTQRIELSRPCRESPSPRARRAAELAQACTEARLLAADETRLPPATFPEARPFAIEEVEDPEFLP